MSYYEIFDIILANRIRFSRSKVPVLINGEIEKPVNVGDYTAAAIRLSITYEDAVYMLTTYLPPNTYFSTIIDPSLDLDGYIVYVE